MKYAIIILLSCFSNTFYCQLISITEYSKFIQKSDSFPDNVVNRLEKEGFTILYNDNSVTSIDLTYKLKDKDAYFYNINIARRGPLRTICLAFNTESAEYTRLLNVITKKMTLQPKSKYGDQRMTFYKDQFNVYFGVFDDEVKDENRTYMLCVYNYAAYKEYYLKNPLEK